MSLTVRPSSHQPQAPAAALRPSAVAQGWRPIAHINQLHPRGADQNYVNGAYNCAPTVVAMLARGHGKLGDLNDAQLIQQLGQDIVTQKGTDPQGVARMLERADVPLAGDALAANYTDADVKQHLNQGHMLIAQVRTMDRDAREKGSAHYVLIQGMTARGNYIVSDPLDHKTYVASPEQLKNAVLKCPPDGGMLIPVASPAEAKALAAPTAPAAGSPAAAPGQTPADRKPTLTEMPAVAPRRTTTQTELAVDAFGPPRRPSLAEMPAVGGVPTKKPTLTEMPAVGQAVTRKPTPPELAVDAFGPTRRPSLTEVPIAGPVAPRKATPPELAVDTFGPTRRPSLTEMPLVGPVAPRTPTLAETPAISAPPTLAPPTLAPPATPAEPLVTQVPVDEPSKDAFTASHDVLEGVDTKFKKPTHLKRDSRLERNERRNEFDLDVHYGHGHRRSGRHHTPAETRSVNEIAKDLLERKARGDTTVYEELAALENSTSAKDQAVLEKIERADLKDPGTGKKFEGDAF